VTAIPKQGNPVGVRTAKRRGEAQLEWTFNVKDRWDWVETAVWTERMLEALERGVKGGRWHSLMDKVYSMRNLRGAFDHVKGNRGIAGVDHNKRWPNKFFHARGLFNLEQARTETVQSSCR